MCVRCAEYECAMYDRDHSFKNVSQTHRFIYWNAMSGGHFWLRLFGPCPCVSALAPAIIFQLIQVGFGLATTLSIAQTILFISGMWIYQRHCGVPYCACTDVASRQIGIDLESVIRRK